MGHYYQEEKNSSYLSRIKITKIKAYHVQQSLVMVQSKKIS